jgi:hypothetical protein
MHNNGVDFFEISEISNQLLALPTTSSALSSNYFNF